MKKHLFAASMLCCFMLNARGQSHSCGTDRKEQELLSANPAYAAFHERDRKAWAENQQMSAAARIIISGTDTSYEVPVVVHVIHSGEAVGSYYNPSDAAIDSMIDYLNRSWTATWPAYPDASGGGVNMKISFVLAKRTPACAPSKGINRVDGSTLSGYAANGVVYAGSLAGATDSAIKTLIRWPFKDYYNIWIVKYLDGPSGYYAGYAYYPGAGKLDGTVIAARYVRPFTSGATDFWYTLPHEIGHAFGLRHTFQGSSGLGSCPPNSDCRTDGDGICDTEPHEFNDGTCESGINPCTGVAFAGVQHNLMNYSTCFNRFTPQQKEKVHFNLNRYRMGLVSSLGATALPSGFMKPRMACIPSTELNSTADMGPQKVSLANLLAYSNGNGTDGGLDYDDQTCMTGAANLYLGRTDTLSVISGINRERVKAWIDFNNNGAFDPAELVLNHVNSAVIPYEEHRALIVIPATAVTGTPLRMRIMGDVPSLDQGPCDKLKYGQTEDYTVIIEKGTGIMDRSARAKVSLYPNPGQNRLYVSTDEPVNISLLSIEGRRILYREQTKELDITTLTNGLYLVQVRDAQGHVLLNSKFLKQD